MKISFRVDASLQIGIGHVMRCLTLADALEAIGADCHFISREHIGHLLEVIEQRGYKVHRLAAPASTFEEAKAPAHAAWLGSTWEADAAETAAVVAALQPEWLVVDHYAIDQRWEEVLAPFCRQMMVIDDLADRKHKCDLLVDQNLGRQPEHYAKLVPAHCRVLTGPHFSLLRPEFAALRSYSLQRRQAQPALRQLLITMGGVDESNATGQVLQALKTCALPAECRITVVMGLTALWLQNVQELAARMPWPTDVVVNVGDMAQRMADSDLAIGAAGGTSWERCCLGLPTLISALADNQKDGARALEAEHAAQFIGETSAISTQLPLALAELLNSDIRSRMSSVASAITDGNGVQIILNEMGLVSDNNLSNRIRPMLQADLLQVLAWRNHPAIRQFMFSQREISLLEHQQWFESAFLSPNKHLCIFEVNQHPLGFVNFDETGNKGVADWGFYKAPHAPKGSGRQFGCAALSYAFTRLKLQKVCGHVLAYNDRSIHFHKALGFKEEGILGEQQFGSSSFHNVICFGLTRHEWQVNS